MEKSKFLFSLALLSNIVLSSCGESISKKTETNEKASTVSEFNNSEISSSDIKYDKYTYPKKYTEEILEKGPSDMLDFRDRDGDKFVGITFSDGKFGTLVIRNGRYFNYSIREKSEVRFASKEDGLQRVWEESKKLQDAGAALGGMVSGKSGPRKKDGSLDMRFKENKK